LTEKTHFEHTKGMATQRKSLPGFLRRSLRRNYEEDDEQDGDLQDSTSHRSQDDEPYPIEIAPISNSIGKETNGATLLRNEERKELAIDISERSISSHGGASVAGELSSHLTDSLRKLSSPFTEEPSFQPKTYKEMQYERTLEASVVNLTDLRKLTWNGIPFQHRATSWKLLLGYLPTNAARREQTLRRRRNEYRDAIAQHYDIDDDSRTLQEQETLRQVLVDVPRTAPSVPLFRNERIKRILNRLLYVWAMRHPASSYVQGINDLATPLLAVFLADYFDETVDVLDGEVMNQLSNEQLDELEADIYWCLTNLLSSIQDHYTSDQPGVQRMVARLEELVNRIDADLCRHLRDTGIEFLQFSFKWMNCLLLREFPLKCVFRLWDTYLSEKAGFEDFHVYVCAAFLCQFSGQLQQMSFDELFGFMQDIPTNDWTDTEIEILLSQAFVLTSLFGGSDAHLTSGQPAK
jgi:hypothetical protein